MPERIQRSRKKGSKLPPDTVVCSRPGKWGNPFRAGGYFRVGRGHGFPGMTWCEALEEKYADSSFTKLADDAHAVDFYRLYLQRYPKDLSELRGKNLACWCKVGAPCHADILLKLANQEI